MPVGIHNQVSKLKADLHLLLITVIWGASFSIVKTALNDASPFFFLILRTTLSTAVFYIIFRSRLRKIDKETLRAGIICGILLGIGFNAQTFGLVYTTASKSAFITGLFVVLVPVLSIIFERTIPRKLLWLGVFLAVAGLYFLTSPAGSDFNLGDAVTLIGSFTFAGYTIAVQIYTKRHDFVQLAFLQILITAIIASLLVIFFETPRVEFSMNLIIAVLSMALIATVFTFYIINKYQRHTSATRAAIIYTMEPLAAAVIAVIFLSETLSSTALLGGALIISGMLVSEIKKT